MAGVKVFLLPGNLYGVVCDDPKHAMFQEAANLLSEVLGDPSEVERNDGQLDQQADWPEDLFRALQDIDEQEGQQWNVFTRAALGSVVAYGIGSNQKKLVRASNLALAIAANPNHPRLAFLEVLDPATGRAIGDHRAAGDQPRSGSAVPPPPPPPDRRRADSWQPSSTSQPPPPPPPSSSNPTQSQPPPPQPASPSTWTAQSAGSQPPPPPPPSSSNPTQWESQSASKSQPPPPPPPSSSNPTRWASQSASKSQPPPPQPASPSTGTAQSAGSQLPQPLPPPPATPPAGTAQSTGSQPPLARPSQAWQWLEDATSSHSHSRKGESPASSADSTASSAPLVADVEGVEGAKQRLVVWRHNRPELTGLQMQLVKTLLKNRGVANAKNWESGFGEEERVSSDLMMVLEHDDYKSTGTGYGDSWITEWLKWDDPFSGGRYTLGKKPAQRKANLLWYFGTETPDEDLFAQQPPATTQTQAPQEMHGGSSPSTHASPPPPPPPPSRQPPTAPSASGPSPSRSHRSPSRTPSDGSSASESMASGLGDQPSSGGRREWRVMAEPNEEELRRLKDRLDVQHCDAVTINTFSSNDTVPLGTDLDPRNNYNNKWMASKIRDPRARPLVQCDLGCRVLDGENIGYTYGADVSSKCHGRKAAYDLTGVIKAVSYYLHRNVRVYLVSKRRDEVKAMPQDEDVNIVWADRTDDVILLKQAQELNCPIVSRDSFKDWSTDPRLDGGLKMWLQEMSWIQTRFSWSPTGEFMPDFENERPVLARR